MIRAFSYYNGSRAMQQYFQSKLLSQIPCIQHAFMGKQEVSLFDAPMIKCRQTHSSIVYHADHDHRGGEEADALVTQTSGLLLTITTADCVPVLVASRTKPLIAAIHAGWKGVTGSIIENTLETMLTITTDLVCAIGPCIQQPNFEVGIDVYDRVPEKQFFVQKFAAADFLVPSSGHCEERSDVAIQSSDQSKWLFDLPGYVAHKIRQMGVTQIDVLDLDTYIDANNFFSYRRGTHQGIAQGRQASCIMLSAMA